MEPLSAVLARVRPGVRVDQQVGGKCAGPLERLSALLALEHFLHAVHGPGGRVNVRLETERYSEYASSSALFSFLGFGLRIQTFLLRL